MATILIVDDDPRVARLVERRLAAAGHACCVEMDGSSALKRVTENGLDLVILDVMLPGVSGFEICRRIRADSKRYTLPIIFLSYMNGQEEIDHALAQGADDFVGKPFELEHLVRRIENLLTASHQSSLVDPGTQLPGAKGIKLIIQKHLNSADPFVLGYIELLGIIDFGRAFGSDARDKAIRHAARILLSTGKSLNSPSFKVGHMGGGHFACILPTDSGRSYCEAAREMWNAHVPELMTSLERPAALDQASRPRLDLLCCLEPCDPRKHLNSRVLFEILGRLREKGHETGTGAVIVDRRI